VIFDQFDNAARMEELKVGMGTKGLLHVSAEELGSAIKTCCSDVAMKENAARLGEQIRKESPLKTFSHALKRFLHERVETGEWAKSYAAYRQACTELEKKHAKAEGPLFGQAIMGEILERLPAVSEHLTKESRRNVKARKTVTAGKCWIVTGQTCLAREGVGLKTPEVGRFRQNTVLEELQVASNGRLQVKRLIGIGPDQGWVSTEVKGTPLLKKATKEDLAEAQRALHGWYTGLSG